MTDERKPAERTTAIKICGIKEEATLRGMAGMQVDYIGFLFAKSRRQVTPERAAQLQEEARRVPMAGGKPPLTVGVFVNPSIEQLEQVLSVVPLISYSFMAKRRRSLRGRCGNGCPLKYGGRCRPETKIRLQERRD